MVYVIYYHIFLLEDHVSIYIYHISYIYVCVYMCFYVYIYILHIMVRFYTVYVFI